MIAEGELYVMHKIAQEILVKQKYLMDENHGVVVTSVKIVTCFWMNRMKWGKILAHLARNSYFHLHEMR